jgi:hypothetical protein
MNRSKLSVKALLLASGIGLAAVSFAGSRPAIAQDYSDDDSCPSGYVLDPSFGYGCTLPGYAYAPYSYGYSPYYGGYYGGYRGEHHEGGHGFAHGMGGGFAHGMGGGFGHGGGGGHR